MFNAKKNQTETLADKKRVKYYDIYTTKITATKSVEKLYYIAVAYYVFYIYDIPILYHSPSQHENFGVENRLDEMDL